MRIKHDYSSFKFKPGDYIKRQGSSGNVMFYVKDCIIIQERDGYVKYYSLYSIFPDECYTDYNYYTEHYIEKFLRHEKVANEV